MLKSILKTYKKSYIILIRYLIVFLGTFIINILVNRYDINTINYFYSVMIIMGLIEGIEVALADTVSIYTLKVCHSKSRTANYLRNIFLCLILFIIFSFLLIFIFREYIFINLLKVNVIDEYCFLILMMTAYIVSLPTLYFQDFIKYNDRYKEYLKTTFLFNIVLILSYFTLSIFFKTINNIAYANVIASILTFIYTFKIIKNNKGIIKFDIIYIFTRKLKEFTDTLIVSFKTVIQYLLFYLGTFLRSLIAISLSSDLFNATQYITSAFILFDGIFESLITTMNIKLTKILSTEDHHKAYEYAAKCIKMIVINQLFLSLIYILLREPILMFINPELLTIAHQIDLYLLLFINLSIIDWTLSYNILLRNHKVTVQILLELFTTIGYIWLLIMVKFNQITNMYTILIAINILILIKIIYNLIYFRTKQWIK